MKLSAISWYIFIRLFFAVEAALEEDHSRDVVGKDCKITEPIYNTTFDLSKLHSDFGHTVVNGDDKIEFNVCGGLNKPCDGANSADACLYMGKKQLKFNAVKPMEPILTNGRLYFNLTGDTCKKDELYTLLIITVCDYSAHISVPIILMPYSVDQCTFVLMWRTPYACHSISAPINSNTCTVKDPRTGHLFNLMPLSEINNKIPSEKNKEFIINVCKPTLYGHNEMCPPNSSICLVNETETDPKKRFLNYGTTVPDPQFENNRLFMRFKSSEICPGTNKTIQSTITFVCDKSVPLGEPEFSHFENCVNSFIWETSLACQNISSCRTIDPITNFVYDLSSLSNQDWHVEHETEKYVFGVCTSPKENCLENVGACLIHKTQSSSMGAVDSQLQLLDGTNVPFLLYQSGSVCETLHQNWNTKIEFVCQEEGMEAGPKVVENTNCSLLIKFATKAVCRTDGSIQCKAYDIENEREIDLSRLKSTTQNYLAKINETLVGKQPSNVLYYLNVCRSLVTQYGLSCSGNTAACRAINGSITPENEQSLGYADISLTIVNTERGRRPQLKYSKGHTCPSHPLTTMSSQIEFYCDPKAGMGTPILQEIMDDCHYAFEWATNIMCQSHIGDFREKTCEVYNDQLNKTFDLHTLFENGLLKVDDTISVEVCKGVKKVSFDYAQSVVKVFLDAKLPCKSKEGTDCGNIYVELRLVCKEVEQVFPSNTESNGFVYIQETPLICPLFAMEEVSKRAEQNKKLHAANGSESNTPTHGLSILGGVLIATTVVTLLLAAVYMFKDQERRDRFMLLFRRRNVTVHYSRVHNNEEADLLLDQPGSLSDSDEDLII